MQKVKARELKYFNDILTLLSDKWISSKKINMVLKEDYPKIRNIGMQVRETLGRMLEEGMVECDDRKSGGEGYKWRLKMK